MPRPADYSLSAHGGELFDQITSVDGKAFGTLWSLVARPGALTAHHLAGKRSRYLRPLQLFLLINVLLFAAAPKMPLFSYSLGNYRTFGPPSSLLVTAFVQRAVTSRRAASLRTSDAPSALEEKEGLQAYTQAFDNRVEAQRKSFIILFAPALALVLWVVFAWRAVTPGVPRQYGEHLVFALHLLAFIWLVCAAYGALGAFVTGRLMSATAKIMVASIAAALILTTPVYVYRALRRAYQLSWFIALAATITVVVSLAPLTLGYRTLLFFTTYYTL